MPLEGPAQVGPTRTYTTLAEARIETQALADRLTKRLLTDNFRTRGSRLRNREVTISGNQARKIADNAGRNHDRGHGNETLSAKKVHAQALPHKYTK